MEVLDNIKIIRSQMNLPFIDQIKTVSPYNLADVITLLVKEIAESNQKCKKCKAKKKLLRLSKDKIPYESNFIFYLRSRLSHKILIYFKQ